MEAVKYRIKRSAMALFVEGDRRTVRSVPAEAIVTLEDETVDNNGLVKVMWEGKPVMMFTDDLRRHAQKIDQISN